MFPIELEVKQRYDSMMKGHTFSPPNSDPRFVFSEALKNMGNVLAKLRRHAHLAKEMGLSLREKDYTHAAWAALPLASPTCHDCEAAPLLRVIFESLFVSGKTYRSTCVWLGGLVPERGRQLDIFDDTPERQSFGKLDDVVDRINGRYGQRTVAPAALLNGRLKPVHSRDAAPERYGTVLKGEEARHLAIPRLTLTNPV
jgi:hypothetical protein